MLASPANQRNASVGRRTAITLGSMNNQRYCMGPHDNGQQDERVGGEEIVRASRGC